MSALCCVDLYSLYILGLLSTYLKTRLSHWSLVLLQPVKDDPHFHHFLLSQSEKVRGSMLLSAPLMYFFVFICFNAGYIFKLSVSFSCLVLFD